MSVLVERELVARVTLTVSLLQLKARSQRDPDCKVSRGFYVNIPIADDRDDDITFLRSDSELTV